MVAQNKTKAGWQTCPCEYSNQQTQSIKSHGLKPERKNALWKARASISALGYSSFDFLRRRRLISPSNAATTNCPVLSPSAFNASTSSAIWCGTRTSNRFDFAFTDFVAIAGFLDIRCPTILHKKKMFLKLDVSDTCELVCVRHLECCCLSKTAKPSSAGTLAGPLTTIVK